MVVSRRRSSGNHLDFRGVVCIPGDTEIVAKSKKDLNYIANVEKAISDKYGEETIQNPKSLWTKEKEEEYIKQLKKFYLMLVDSFLICKFLKIKDLLDKDSNQDILYTFFALKKKFYICCFLRKKIFYYYLF